MLGDLFRPFSYLTIRHPSRLPLWVNWLLPVGGAGVVMAVLLGFDVAINAFGEQGFVARLLAFVQTLVGFYIAALAAVASFNSRHLDRVMPSPPPTMRVKYNGALQTVPLTRRRFLCAMFAYLTALSFLFSLAAITVLSLAPSMTAIATVTMTFALKPAVLALFLLAAFQMTSITFWGLFYLGERMLTPD
ncbi:hypothetical protein [Thauera sp.]|uniref:hypothetical protein n=1 Tax=Thauera sp. TaxID=1905334 RepID=UPI002C223243|nr:hypothetical protein [Thauera sp.]HRO37050.1 hypothetical protein [Thauera sp.]